MKRLFTLIACALVFFNAQASQQTSDPWITVSTEHLYICLSYVNGFEDAVSFNFSAGDLAKSLYCKWENSAPNVMPTWGGTWYNAYMGNIELDYGSATNLGTDDVTDATVEFYIGATQEGTYRTSFLLYTFKADSKTEYAAAKRVIVDIVVTYGEPIPDPTALDESQISNRQSQIINILGQPVGKDYHGIVIQNGQKRLQ